MALKPSVLMTTDGRFRHIVPGNGRHFSLEELQAAVGGDIQILETPTGMSIVMDEEGKLKNRTINHAATDMLRGIIGTDIIVGDVVYCHPDLLEK